MSTTVLPQLLEVDSELSAQATVLEAKLNELQKKRRGIQTVISMFDSGLDSELNSAPESNETPAAKPTAVMQAPTTTKTATRKTATGVKTTGKRTAAKRKVAKPAADKSAVQSSPKKSAKTTATRSTKAKAATGAAAKAVSKKTKTKSTRTAAAKRSGRKADWQRYVQRTYKKSPLPDVIVGVLQAQPDNVFKIADVMDVVFKEDMPKGHFLKARNRISNILSAGARDGVWHRGRGGTYSMSEKAIKAS
ncbi:MAG: hypothetical protein AAF716_15860 [Cyanobacteria bacterium P01_D01_bin.1]